MPWSSALRSRCSSGPTSFSSTERSSSTCAPRISRLARLSSSFAVCAQDAVQPLRQAAERHGADREQLLLHVARQARLREQRGVGVVEVLEQRLLDRGDVVDALGQRARQLLEARVAVEFQRIEALGGLARPCDIRDWICDSAWISISRTCARSRMTLPVSSSRFALSERSSPSTRARAIATSPASFTSRSIMSARTRSMRALPGFGFGGRRAAAARVAPAAARAARRRRDRRRGVDGGARGRSPAAPRPAAAAASARGSQPRQRDVGLRPSRSASSTKAIWSRSSSSASNSSGVGRPARRRRASRGFPSGA